MILPCEIPQLDIPDVDRNLKLQFFLLPVNKIISVQMIYSDSLFVYIKIVVEPNNKSPHFTPHYQSISFIILILKNHFVLLLLCKT